MIIFQCHSVSSVIRALGVALLCLGQVLAADSPEPVVTISSPAQRAEAEAALKQMRVTSGLRATVFASEPLIQNVVSFAFDAQGRAYVVESHRRRTSVLDIRRYQHWLEDDLAFRSVSDRSNFLMKAMLPSTDVIRDLNEDGKTNVFDFAVESERIRLVTDADGDGLADRAITYADGFNSIVSGVAAGVLPFQESVYFACIPDLWQLHDLDEDSVADQRQSLHHGFGVHIGYGGHDMHGLIVGPDGKLYWSIADRGARVEHQGELIINQPDTGAVFRCNPDGSELELFAFGLRNPQELAFDDHGNLWTADNNADGGDAARWVYLVEGSDSGWTIGWQWLPKLGAWNSEKLWELPEKNDAAYLLPPIAHIGHGPAGLAYYPGTGLSSEYQGHFFLCDFPGGVRAFSTKPRGASFEVEQSGKVLQDNSSAKMEQKLIWGLYPVDVAFAPDGGIFVADWVQGWEKTGKGRIFKLHQPDSDDARLARETGDILKMGMSGRGDTELLTLLGHADQRVRLAAQFALAKRGTNAIPSLAAVAADAAQSLARLHAIWGLGQIGRQEASAYAPLVALLTDGNSEVRAQSAKVLGEARAPELIDDFVELLRDPEPRVAFFAAYGLGKLRNPAAIPALFELLRTNDNRDRFLRHAAVMALVQINDLNAILTAGKDASDAVRLGSLLALRRLERPEVAIFLHDSSPQIVLEAARAINDLPLDGALPQLAALIDARNGAYAVPDEVAEPVLRRALNANFRLGKTENAVALVAFSAREENPDSLRIESMRALGLWPEPPPRDQVTGLFRPLASRDPRAVTIPFRAGLPALMKAGAESVRAAAIQTIEQLGLTSASPLLAAAINDPEAGLPVRLAALRALVQLKAPEAAAAIRTCSESAEEVLRVEAAKLQAFIPSLGGVEELRRLLNEGSTAEKQAALARLAKVRGAAADVLAREWINRLVAGQVPRDLQLDVLALSEREAWFHEQVDLYWSGQDKNDPLFGYREALYGGNSESGKKIFFERPDAACLRCHKINGEGGDVGPDLTGIGKKYSREYILESLLYPNRQIAQGYETLLVRLKNGQSVIGQLKSDTPEELVISSPEDGVVSVAKRDIESRQAGLSAMPPEITNLLSKRELRDLIEFLVASPSSPSSQ